MEKNNQVAKNAKKGAVKQWNTNKAAMKTTNATKPNKKQQGGKKGKIEAKTLAPAKKVTEESDDEDDDEDSGADLMETTKNDVSQNGDSGEDDNVDESDSGDEENGEPNEDSESEDDAPVEQAIEKKPQQKPQPGKNVENRDRRVYVRRLNVDSTVEKIKEHFSQCGEIESVNIMKAPRLKKDAVIVFKDTTSVAEALKLHNTILNDSNILVEHAESPRPKSDEHRSIILMNTEALPKIEASVIEEIFSKCGKIDSLNVVCEKNVLAYIMFENSSAIPKAMELNGTTQNGIKVDVNLYKSKQKLQKTKVFVKNIASGVSEEDLTNMFQACGNVVKISLKNNNATLATAIIEFEDQDGYCKAFLLHEEKLRGRSLFIEPFSAPRKFGGQKKGPQNGGYNKEKRQAGKNWKGGPPKKMQKKN